MIGRRYSTNAYLLESVVRVSGGEGAGVVAFSADVIDCEEAISTRSPHAEKSIYLTSC